MSQSSTHTQEEKVTSTTKDTPVKESGHRGNDPAHSTYYEVLLL